MQLVKREHNASVSSACLAEVRDAGERLEYLINRYERLVRDIARELAPGSDLQSRVRLLNRELGMLAISIQEALLASREDGDVRGLSRDGKDVGRLAAMA